WRRVDQEEDPLLAVATATPTITVRGDVAENLQPPDVSTALMATCRSGGGPAARRRDRYADHHRPRRCCGEPAA
ncbi:hypothetical protein CQA61_30170, partial [Klebsiella pneumoniae]